MLLQIDTDRLVAELLELAQFSDHPAPAVTRVVFSPTDMTSRVWLRERFHAAGLTVHEDPIGNTFARWEGSDPTLAAVGTGSHTDAIPHAGLYDGCVGVLGGLEAIRALQRSGFKPRRSIELVLFTSEEPTRFGMGCTGSRAMAGLLTPEKLRALRDGEGRNYDEVRTAAGFTGPLEAIALMPGHYDSWVELHIEQGPILEREGLAIGIVEAIAAPASLTIEFEGVGGHAGAVLMPERRDALCAAAEVVLAVETIGRSTGSPDTVATTGILEVHPGAVNSIPSRTTLKIDVRDIRLESRDGAVDAIHAAAVEVARRRGVGVTVKLLNADPPALSGPRVLAAIEAACAAERVTSRRLISRAYHDSLFMARLAPIAMIFIPCRGGVSHRPDEYSTPEHIGRGAAVLARTLATLAG